jgi:hypothetical protein
MGKQASVVIIGTLTSLCLMVSALTTAGCAHKESDFMEPLILSPPPITITVEQIVNEYGVDPILADAKYFGKKLLFNEVVVDGIHTMYNNPGAGMPFTLTIDYFTVGNVSFQLLDFKDAQQYVQAGYVLKLEGFCRGLNGGFVHINDCWYQSIKGDLGTGQTRIGGY